MWGERTFEGYLEPKFGRRITGDLDEHLSLSCTYPHLLKQTGEAADVLQPVFARVDAVLKPRLTEGVLKVVGTWTMFDLLPLAGFTQAEPPPSTLGSKPSKTSDNAVGPNRPQKTSPKNSWKGDKTCHICPVVVLGQKTILGIGILKKAPVVQEAGGSRYVRRIDRRVHPGKIFLDGRPVQRNIDFLCRGGDRGKKRAQECPKCDKKAQAVKIVRFAAIPTACFTWER